MAHIRDTANGSESSTADDVREVLAAAGVAYERWEVRSELSDDASPVEILAAYAAQLNAVKADGGYTTSDVIDLHPDVSGLEEMLARFNSEHWHDEDEVRFIIDGRGLFHINTDQGVLVLEVEAGDFLRVPSGTLHWFDLCADRRLRAIRLFQDRSGWTPHYTDSGVDERFQPLCFGPSYIPTDAIAPVVAVPLPRSAINGV
jgi:1,2-dihydroxy-3-keto-5-methylthiopentene dioxygenase